MLALTVFAALQVAGAGTIPYEVVPGSPAASSIAAHLGQATEAAWLEGNVLNFVIRAKSDMARVTGSVEQGMERTKGSLWTLRLRMAEWDAVNVRYAFFTSEKGTGKLHLWHGSRAPIPFVRAAKLQGHLAERVCPSNALGADRKLTVYLPPGSDGRGLPAFYMADGQSCRSFAEVLEPLILAHKVAPVAIVGVHNALDGMEDKGMAEQMAARSGEYFPGRSGERFEAHLRFFAEEAVSFAEKEFGLSSRREDRAVLGYSDGGSFAEVAAIRYPGTFGATIPLSPGYPLPNGIDSHELPRFFFAAGRLEPFLATTSRSFKEVQRRGGRAFLRTYFGGHEEWTWASAFAEFAPLVFPPRA